jgi:hypothetical protein
MSILMRVDELIKQKDRNGTCPPQAAGAAALPFLSSSAGAQSYPTRPVRWIVGFPPGGGADTASRIVAD